MRLSDPLTTDRCPNGAHEEVSEDVLADFEPDFETDRMADAAARRVLSDESVFQSVWCSQCGGAFGPGDSGFSHCSQHGGLPCTF